MPRGRMALEGAVDFIGSNATARAPERPMVKFQNVFARSSNAVEKVFKDAQPGSCSERAMLHTMERLVSSLLQSKGEESVVVTVEMGVSCSVTQGDGEMADMVFPALDINEAGKWEENKKDGFRKRQVTFTGSNVSVAFPERARWYARWYGTLPDRIFGAEIWDKKRLDTLRSKPRWNLARVEIWDDRPYFLHYECNGVTIKLSETARDKEWDRRLDQAIREKARRRAEIERIDQDTTDRLWKQAQSYPIR